MIGTIIKGIAGFYYVKVLDKVYECKARGKFRYAELTPMVGDKVEISLVNNKGSVEKIFERKNELIRPVVSNVTQAFVVFALKNPDINLELLNKFLVLCEHKDIKLVVCFNKLDLVDAKSNEEVINMVQSAGYETLFLKAKEGYGIEQIKERLKDNVTVFCGPSGVGKSTILNTVLGNEFMKTGEISVRLGRGKHTTRHSELVDVNGGFVVDTPGFTSLEVDSIPKEDLAECFPEFNEYRGKCKFTSCIHNKEPKCAIKEAVEENKINKLRYDFYIKTLEEANGRRNKKYD